MRFAPDTFIRRKSTSPTFDFEFKFDTSNHPLKSFGDGILICSDNEDNLMMGDDFSGQLDIQFDEDIQQDSFCLFSDSLELSKIEPQFDEQVDISDIAYNLDIEENIKHGVIKLNSNACNNCDNILEELLKDDE